MMLRICRAKARRYIPSLRVGFCSAALQGGIGCKQYRAGVEFDLLFAGVQPSHSGGGIWFCPYGCPILRVLCEGWERPL